MWPRKTNEGGGGRLDMAKAPAADAADTGADDDVRELIVKLSRE